MRYTPDYPLCLSLGCNITNEGLYTLVVDDCAPLFCPYSASSGSQIQASGNGTLAVYQSILLNLQYENPADEPTPGERIVTLRVNDGVHNSADLNISLFVVLRDDNNLTLTCRSSKSLFHMEGASAPTLILPQAVVQDKDQDHIVRQAFVQLQTVLDSGSESLSLNTSMLLGSNLTMTRSSDNTSVTVEGEATDTVYQVSSCA